MPAFVAFLVMVGFDGRGQQGGRPGTCVSGRRSASRWSPASSSAMALYLLVIRRLGQVSAATSLVANTGVTLLLTTIEINVFEVGPAVPRFSGGFHLPGVDIVARRPHISCATASAGRAAGSCDRLRRTCARGRPPRGPRRRSG